MKMYFRYFGIGHSTGFNFIELAAILLVAGLVTTLVVTNTNKKLTEASALSEVRNIYSLLDELYKCLRKTRLGEIHDVDQRCTYYDKSKRWTVGMKSSVWIKSEELTDKSNFTYTVKVNNRLPFVHINNSWVIFNVATKKLNDVDGYLVLQHVYRLLLVDAGVEHLFANQAISGLNNIDFIIKEPAAEKFVVNVSLRKPVELHANAGSISHLDLQGGSLDLGDVTTSGDGGVLFDKIIFPYVDNNGIESEVVLDYPLLTFIRVLSSIQYTGQTSHSGGPPYYQSGIFPYYQRQCRWGLRAPNPLGGFNTTEREEPEQFVVRGENVDSHNEDLLLQHLRRSTRICNGMMYSNNYGLVRRNDDSVWRRNILSFWSNWFISASTTEALNHDFSDERRVEQYFATGFEYMPNLIYLPVPFSLLNNGYLGMHFRLGRANQFAQNLFGGLDGYSVDVFHSWFNGPILHLHPVTDCPGKIMTWRVRKNDGPESDTIVESGLWHSHKKVLNFAEHAHGRVRVINCKSGAVSFDGI